ncbi:Pantothenate transporter [Pseudozyma hubeiensis]|nr:Pantothenate transporter [Pseudozyma hubeiensis]
MLALFHRWLLATFPVFLLLLLHPLTFSTATIYRRDTHSLVVPLTFEPTSSLMTASISIGSSHSTYNLIVDTGSPFLVVQNSSFHPSSSTYDPQGAGQPDLGGATGYITTKPQPDGKGPVKPTIHFIEDQAYLNEGSGERAGGGAKGGNVTIGLTELGDLKGAQGILGLSPPLSLVKPPSGQGGSGGKGKRSPHPHPPSGHGEAGKLPSLDTSFLHSYLSPSHRQVIGMTGSSHFYIDFSPSTITNTTPTGEIVFPLTGTSLPQTSFGYNYSNAITIDPSRGSTFPTHPFWGIAHRNDLQFTLNDTPLPDIRIDALLLDSGTSGIIAPPSEVSKIFSLQNSISTSSPAGTSAVLGKTSCESGLKMGLSIGGQKVRFEAIRRSVQPNGQFVQSKHDREDPQDEDWTKRSTYDGVNRWKSYLLGDAVQGIHDLLHDLTGLLPIGFRKRSIHKRLSLGFLTTSPSTPPNPLDLTSHIKPNPTPPEQCQLSLIGSPQVEQMFPSNKDLKVWLLGMEFFQSNLVYHNLDTCQTVIVPRNDA